MRGNLAILAVLNQLLAGELTAVDQYVAHAAMYERWGFAALAKRVAHETDDERGHCKRLIDRILFLEGTPDLVTRRPLSIGKTVAEMLANDLALELSVVAALRAAIASCDSLHDFATRDMLMVLLKDTEEDHVHWLEQQLEQIRQVGLPNYLQQQIRE